MNASFSESLREYEEEGSTTIDTPFSEEEIGAAAAAVDTLFPQQAASGNYRMQRTNDFFNPELIHFIQHPFFESVAQEVLRTDYVRFFQSTVAKTFPESGKPFSFWEHIDIKYTSADWSDTPRRIICSFALWLVDITIETAPFMVRPRSHIQLAREMDSHPVYIDNPMGMDRVPKLPFAEPVPILAKAGQATLVTSATVHGASICTGHIPRKVLFINFVARDAKIRANMDWETDRIRYYSELRRCLRPERRHLLPEF